MVLEVDASVELDVDAASKVKQAHRKRLEDSMAKGFSVAHDATPSGATNSLKGTMFEPTWRSNGRIEFGWREDYARPVNDGSSPHYIPLRAMPDLKKWARRVLGDESAAWAVREKIAQEGTEGAHMAEAGREAAGRHLKGHPLGEYLDL